MSLQNLRGLHTESELKLHPLRLRARSATTFGAAILSATLFWIRGIAQLYARHPHEDSYILFRYAEHLAQGAGIVYNVGGPPTEGATDFLWMVLLAGCRSLGMDVAYAAVTLNAFGCGLLAYLFARLCLRSQDAHFADHILAWMLAVSLPFLNAAHASYEGFSTQLYVALIVLTYAATVGSCKTTARLLPYCALLLGLFRPDGLIVGGSFVLVGAWRCLREDATRRPALLHSGLAILLGTGYFLWRYRYFGELLPLPLYVKSHGEGRLLGLRSNLDWLKAGSGPLPCLGLGGLLLGLLPATKHSTPLPLLFAASGLPAMALLLALTFAHQSQNVDFRFQAPIFNILLALNIGLRAGLASSRRPAAVRAVTLAGFGAVLIVAAIAGKSRVWELSYIDSFAVRSAPITRRATVVTTEAGRLPYWTDAAAHDIVGLNNAHTAKRPPTVGFIRSLNPDVVMYHKGGALDMHRIPALRAESVSHAVVQLDPASLPAAVREPYRRYIDHDVSNYAEAPVQTNVAVLALTRFLATSSDYDVFATLYGAGFNHIYGVHRRWDNRQAFIAELTRAHQMPYLSYAAAKGFPSQTLPCRLAAGLARWRGPGVLSLPEAPHCGAKSFEARLDHWSRDTQRQAP